MLKHLASVLWVALFGLSSMSAQADCRALTPDTSPTANYTNIRNCLDDGGIAILTTGTYPVSQTIEIGDSQVLLGQDDPYTWPVIQLAALNDGLIQFVGSSGRVGFLGLDSNGELPDAGTDIGTVLIRDLLPDGGIHAVTDNLLDDNHIFNSSDAGNWFDSSAVWVFCSLCEGNSILRNQIYGNFDGVAFQGATSSYVNTADSNSIFNNQCDSIHFGGGPGSDFRGYGVATNNTIYHNGWNCLNGPVPGGGIYANQDSAGALVTGNEVYDNCGMSVDIDRAANLTIEDNYFHDPGYTWGGTYSYCGTVAMRLPRIRGHRS